MAAIIYMILCILTGEVLASPFVLRRNKGSLLWVLLPAAFGTGTLLLTWSVYIVSYLMKVYGHSANPLFWGNLIVMAIAALVVGAIWLMRVQDKVKSGFARSMAGRKRKLFFREVILFTFLGLFLLWIFFYVFQIRNGTLYSGFTVFSDYAPHTAMIRSFSRQNNFPTQYPHFGGQDVKYHFMFQFFTGNLEYLGMRLDLAYNLASVLSLLGFLMLLYMLSLRITGKAMAGGLAILFFFFRSGLSFFRFVWEHAQAGDLVDTLLHNTAFIGYTMNENWGLWCFNVYLNQRHLGFGLLILAMVLWVFMDWLEGGEELGRNGRSWIGEILFSVKAWKTADLKTAVFCGIFLGLCAFWNGATVIGGLLILAGVGLFSIGKVDYAVMAAITIVLSEVQSKVFMTTSAVQPSFYWGLLAYDTSFLGVLWFLLQVSGIYFLGFAFLALFVDRKQRNIMFAFLLPLVFSLTVSLTPDISVNHKYVMIAYAMLTMFWADALIRIWKKGLGARVLAILLAVFLFATGIYDFVVVLKDNDRGHRIGTLVDSELTDWLDENLDSSDLVLSPEYSIHEVTMSGVMLYLGWPYYAWSAGYDTDYRKDVALEIYTTSDPEKIKHLVAKEEITYIIYEEGMTIDEQECYDDVIRTIYPMVYLSENSRLRIYQVHP